MLRHHFSRRLKFSLKVRFKCTARLKLTPICNVFEPLFIAHILRTTILTSCALPPVCSVALAISMFLDPEGCFRMKKETRRVRLYTWKANAVTHSLNWPTLQAVASLPSSKCIYRHTIIETYVFTVPNEQFGVSSLGALLLGLTGRCHAVRCTESA